jgi:4-hydroxy-3-methylbut-2-en-1-yl diphosphate synthase IspG/GcpE
MIHALYHIKPEEVAIVSSILQKYTDSYSVSFELQDIVCPHCGRKTKRIPLDINYLVFLKYQRLMSTELNIDNISVL